MKIQLEAQHVDAIAQRVGELLKPYLSEREEKKVKASYNGRLR